MQQPTLLLVMSLTKIMPSLRAKQSMTVSCMFLAVCLCSL